VDVVIEPAVAVDRVPTSTQGKRSSRAEERLEFGSRKGRVGQAVE
jgi:hypothetical protein